MTPTREERAYQLAVLRANRRLNDTVVLYQGEPVTVDYWVSPTSVKIRTATGRLIQTGSRHLTFTDTPREHTS